MTKIFILYNVDYDRYVTFKKAFTQKNIAEFHANNLNEIEGENWYLVDEVELID